jgi:hypothetical protein
LMREDKRVEESTFRHGWTAGKINIRRPDPFYVRIMESEKRQKNNKRFAFGFLCYKTLTYECLSCFVNVGFGYL